MHPLSLADSSAVPPDDSNWITWKGQMVSILELNDARGHCDGSVPHPDDPCKAKEWMKAEKVEDDLREYRACTVCPCCASYDGEANVGEPGISPRDTRPTRYYCVTTYLVSHKCAEER